MSGLIRHVVATTAQTNDLLANLRPHETTIIDVVLSRRVAKGVFRITDKLTPVEDFRHPTPGAELL